MPRLMVEAALTAGSETPTQRREAMAELFAIRRVLSNNAININQMAKAVNIDGVRPVEAAGFLPEARTLVGRIDQTVSGVGAAMMPNITRGDRPGGLMVYLASEGRHNEHENPHLVAGDSQIMVWHDDAELSRVDALARVENPRCPPSGVVGRFSTGLRGR